MSNFLFGVLTTLTAQLKEGLYYDHYTMDMFFFLAIEVFGCSHH
jgi:hypothetical protein